MLNLKSRPLLRSTFFLTIAALCLRGLGLAFQVVISNRIGASGTGLFSLVISVYSLALTVAISGVRYAVTRLVAEQETLAPENIPKVMRKCFAYALVFSFAALFALFNAADYIGRYWLDDVRVIPSLRIMAIGLPAISLSSVMGGYFTAMRRAVRGSVDQIVEQISMLIATVILIDMVPQTLDYQCAAIALGAVIADFCGFFTSCGLYYFDKRKDKRLYAGSARAAPVPKLLPVAIPVAMTAYARVALTTIQHLMIPSGLKRSGLNGETALAAYGQLHAMAFPIVMFPAVIMSSAAELIVPELTAAQAAGRTLKVRNIVNRVLKLSFAFALICAVLLFLLSDQLGQLFYKSDEVGRYIRMFSPLVVVMYLDMITDGMLKGLGEQVYTMGVNILDSGVSLLLVWLTLPIWGLNGYIFMVFFTELFNFALSIKRLRRFTR
jgi:stage V sporulation protein B